MKKLVALMLAASFLLTTAGSVFAGMPGPVHSINGQPGGCMARTHGTCISHHN